MTRLRLTSIAVGVSIVLAAAANNIVFGQTKIKHVDPVYPANAIAAGVQGTVTLQVMIGIDGHVTVQRIVRSISLLDAAAMTAVRQWQYDASRLRAPVSRMVSVPFTLPPPTAPRATTASPVSPGQGGPAVPAAGVTLPGSRSAQALTPQQEIRQLTATINSGTLDEASRRAALRRRGYLYATTGMLGFARADLDALIALDPNDRDAHFFLGLARFQGNPRAALQSFSRVIALEPNGAEGYAARAWTNAIAGDHGAAISDFGQVLRLKPGDREALRGRAWSLVMSGRYDESIADLNTLLASPTTLPEAVALRSVALYLGGHLKEARAGFRSAMRFPPVVNRDIPTYNTVRLDNWQRYRLLQRVIDVRTAKNPRDVEGWLAFGVIGFRAYDNPEGTGTGAGDAFTRALNIAPADIDALMIRAASRSVPYRRYDPAGAIADLSEAIRLSPDHTEAYFQRSLLYAADAYKNSYPAAIADCEKALALAPGEPLLRRLLEKITVDQRAAEEEKRRTIAAKIQRAQDAEAGAALFLGALAVLAVMNPDTRPFSERHQEFLDDVERALALDTP